MKSTAISFVRFYFVALAIALILGNVDYELAKRTGRAWLSVPIAVLSDGGSRQCLGFGYTLMCRHKIHRVEGDRTIYLVGPELKAWNIFNILGARRLFDRHYADVLYYRRGDRTDPVIRASRIGDRMGQKIFLALTDLFPLAVLFGLFSVWRQIRKRIPRKPCTPTK